MEPLRGIGVSPIFPRPHDPSAISFLASFVPDRSPGKEPVMDPMVPSMVPVKPAIAARAGI